MTHLTIASILVSTLALTPSAPPILPFTELSQTKIQTALQHIVDANECSVTDLNVVLQLDHIRWKYEEMRKAYYAVAREAVDGATVNAKDLGKMFDTIDVALEKTREADLQESAKRVQEATKANTPRKNEV
jgi:hypothetical protein